MHHKELERWYRLRNIKMAAQVLIVMSMVFAGGAYLVARFWSAAEEKMWPDPPHTAGIRIENFSYSSPGAHPWELRAHGAEVSEGFDVVKLWQPNVTYKGGHGGEITLHSRSGELDKKNRSFSARGAVTIRYQNFVFVTEHIEYSHEQLRAETSSTVSLTSGEDMVLTGKGLKVSVEQEEMIIEEDVKATLFKVNWVNTRGKLPL